MNLPYLPRLILLCAATVFWVHTGLALVVAIAARGAIRFAGRQRPFVGARVVLCLRLLPAAMAGYLGWGLGISSYLALEPRGTEERIGPACLIAGLFGIAICVVGLARGFAIAIRSAKRFRSCRETGAPLLAVAGIVRLRVVVSAGVRASLAPDELAAALRHEEAHRHAHDNLKRFLILASPIVFPFSRAFRALDGAWRRLAECAADDYAAGESAERALALASALVRVGRMRAGIPLEPLGASFLTETDDLRKRVERLIGDRAPEQPRRAFAPAGAAIVLASALALIQPSLLGYAHRCIEALGH